MSQYLPFLTTQALRPFARFFPDMLWRKESEPGEKVAYLTFDDGPTPEMTIDLLRLLASFGVPATWFMIGAHMRARPDLAHEIIDRGHSTGNHTLTHPDAWITPVERIREELYLTSELIEQFTGKPPRLMRPPYGHFTGAMRHWCQANGHEMVMWDVMPGDFLPTATTEAMVTHIARTIRPGSIIVLHDNPVAHELTLGALRQLLPTLLAEGWTFKPL